MSYNDFVIPTNKPMVYVIHYVYANSDLISLSDFYVFLITYQRNRTKTFSQKLLDVYAVLMHLAVTVYSYLVL